MADEKQFSHRADEIQLENSIYGGTPPEELNPDDRGDYKSDAVSGISGESMFEYYREGTIGDVPVPQEWQNLLLKDNELETVFRDEHYIESICFVHLPENKGYEVPPAEHKDYEAMLARYHTLLRAVSAGVGYILTDSCTYDPVQNGYVVRLVVSLRRKIVRASFRGHVQKVPDDTLKKLKEQDIPNEKES